MATYNYTPNIPQANQLIKATQPPILNNFQAINDLINVNHVGFTDATNYGKHTFTSFPFLPSDPNTAAGEITVYSKATVSGPNAGELFYRYPSNGAVVQLTGGTGGGIAGDPGYAYMSTTVFMVWGLATGIVTGANVINFPSGAGFPSFGSTPYQVYYQPNVSYTNVNCGTYISSSSASSWTLQVPASNYATSVYWMAIGST